MKVWTRIGAISALLAVMLGAFGAHGLKQVLSGNALSTFEIGVRYQMYHALAILLVVVLSDHLSAQWQRRALYCFLIGTLLFSGSLYLLSTTGMTVFGPVTPLGGVALMAGWICVIVGGARSDG